MINLGAEILPTLKKLLQDPEEPVSRGQRQPIRQSAEKVLIGVRGPFKIHGINIPELQKRLEKFQGGNISSQIFNSKKITKDQVILDNIQ